MFRRTLLASLAAPLLARARGPVRLGVLTTLNGPAADGAGSGSVLAARLAMEDFPGVAASLLVADMGERAETAAATAREWIDREGVHAILDVPNSAMALAVATLVREKDRIALFSGPGATALTRDCSPNHLQWTYDTAALAAGSARAIVAEGGRTWFFITADYVFGRSLQADVSAVVAQQGGRVLGAAAFPNEMADFSALLLQARASGADVVALAAAGGPFETLVKQAGEFGIARGGQRLASPLCLITNVHAIGLAASQGLLVTSPFYWDFDSGTRAFAARFMPRNRGIAPTLTHAGVYSATSHLLRTVAAGADPGQGAATIAAMKRLPAHDALFGDSVLRPDGGVSHPMHLFEVKAPAAQRAPWDYYRLLRTISADEAFRRAAVC